MAIETLELDLANWSVQSESFFTNESENIKNEKEIKSADLSLDIGGHEWDLNEMDEFWKNLESDFVNDPSLTCEVMTSKVSGQDEKLMDMMLCNDTLYNSASAFLSPDSIASQPSSPQTAQTQFEHQIGNVEKQSTANEKMSEEVDPMLAFLDEENTYAMEFLNKILESNAELESLDGSLSPARENEIENEIEQESELEVMTPEAVAPKRSNRKRARASSQEDDPVWEPHGNTNKRAKASRPVKTTKQGKRGSLSTEMKKERKKDQNKTAANRYRQKKRIEMETVEALENEQLEIRDKLSEKLKNLQMEFKCILPLAQKAFITDSYRMLKLQMIERNVAKGHLMD